MAYYYKIHDTEDVLPSYKGFHLQKSKKSKVTLPNINFDFTKYVLIELLDDLTPETKLWNELGLADNNNIVHKRMMFDSHRIKCRRAIVVCTDSDIAKKLAERLSQTKVMGRNICAVVVEDMLTDLRLFEKQIMQFGDKKTQHQLVYVSDLNRCQEPSGLVRYLKKKFSPFGTILSILVCADDDKSAFPEGVIKFAYLSEAFAAELALDQFIVGRERLSVIVHHNMLLSQCDLRARLRNAQWSNDSEYPVLTESHSLSCSLGVNSVDNLQISCKENSTEKDVNRLSCNNRSNAFYSKCKVNSKSKTVLNKTSHVSDRSQNILNSNKAFDSVSISSTDNLCYTASNDKTTIIIDNNLTNNCDNIDKLNLKQFSQNISISEDLVKHRVKKIQVSKNQQHNFKTVRNPDCQFKFSESESNSGSYYSCKNDHNDSFHSDVNLYISPEKTVLTNVECSYDDVTLTQDYPVSSQLKQLSSTPIGNVNELEVKMKPTKTTNKRKKLFIPSQKLCLKSQRIGLSQKENKNTLTGSENSLLCSSQQPPKSTSVLKSNLYASTISAQVLDRDMSSLSKVSDWLSNLPKSEDIEYVSKMSKSFDEESNTNAGHCHRRISIYVTPSLKQNFQNIAENSLSNKSCIENEEPNKGTVVSNETETVILTEKSKSLLQKWLKQELISSINNTVISCEDMSKCFVVYATRSQDVAVSVGCSHMTCDYCYPESTNLLLGYG